MASLDTDSAVAGSAAIICIFRAGFEPDVNSHSNAEDVQVCRCSDPPHFPSLYT